MNSMNRAGVVRSVAAAALSIGFAGAQASAQDAVQWRVEDGGNGHWYELRELPERPTCVQAQTMANSAGGSLVALETAVELEYFKALRCLQEKQHLSAWQDLSWVGNAWVWGSGAPFNFQSWNPVYPPDGGGTATIDWAGPSGQCDTLVWGDEHCLVANLPSSLFIEWSADCNADGIVDYGQCHDGSLADANANNIPDCCEQGVSCTPCLGDITGGDGVNGTDLAALLSAWGSDGQGQYDTDITDDGLVDGADLTILLSAWGPCP